MQGNTSLWGKIRRGGLVFITWKVTRRVLELIAALRSEGAL